jgi:hypothetical protein
MRVRKALRFLVAAPLLLLGGCGAMYSPGGISPQYPPFPATSSILPLGSGNSWSYSLTAYDSLGNKIIPSRVGLALDIPGGFGLMDDTLLGPITWQNHEQVFPAYVYKFEWDKRDSGSLVVHRGTYPLGSRGLYVIGWYRRGETHLFPGEKLWLPYPADSGKTWLFDSDTSADSTSADTMEILSTHAPFFAPDPLSPSAGDIYDCYLYKESNGVLTSYYYYNPDIGCVGFLNYQDGKLRMSYSLKEYSVQ